MNGQHKKKVAFDYHSRKVISMKRPYMHKTQKDLKASPEVIQCQETRQKAFCVASSASAWVTAPCSCTGMGHPFWLPLYSVNNKGNFFNLDIQYVGIRYRKFFSQIQTHALLAGTIILTYFSTSPNKQKLYGQIDAFLFSAPAVRDLAYIHGGIGTRKKFQKSRISFSGEKGRRESVSKLNRIGIE